MKIQRQKQIDITTDTHTIMVTLTSTDVKNIFLHIRDLLTKSLGMSYNPVFTTEDLKYSIRYSFSWLGDYKERVTDWALQVAIKHEYILKSSEVGYTINPKILKMRPGRTPRKVLAELDD